MAIIQTRVPYNAFIDPSTGDPLAFGTLFFGDADQDPVDFPKDVQSIDPSDGSRVDVAQPVQTNAAGIPIVNNIPVQLAIDGDYSLLVRNRVGVQVFFSRTSNDANADTLRASNNLNDVDSATAAVASLGLTGALIGDNNLDDVSDAEQARTNLGLDGALLASNNLSDISDAGDARSNLGLSDGAVGLITVRKSTNEQAPAFVVALPSNGSYYIRATANSYSVSRTVQGDQTFTLAVNAVTVDSILVSKLGDASAHRDFEYISPQVAGTYVHATGAGNVNVTLTKTGADVFNFREVYLEVSAV